MLASQMLIAPSLIIPSLTKLKRYLRKNTYLFNSRFLGLSTVVPHWYMDEIITGKRKNTEHQKILS